MTNITKIINEILVSLAPALITFTLNSQTQMDTNFEKIPSLNCEKFTLGNLVHAKNAKKRQER